MAWTFATSVIIAIMILSLALSPQIGSYSHTSTTLIAAPPSYVRQELLSVDLIPRMHQAGKDTQLYAIQLSRGGSVLNAKVGDKIVAVDSEGASITAKVTTHNETTTVWRVDRGWGQRVYYGYTFTALDEALLGFPEGSTRLVYKRTWKGSALLFHARQNFPGWEWLIGDFFLGAGDIDTHFPQNGAIAEVSRRWKESN